VRPWTRSVLPAAVLLVVPAASALAQTTVEVPWCIPPVIDGELAPGEWDEAAELPTEDLPVVAKAMHDGETFYLAFECLPCAEPGTDWEAFAVRDDGDGELCEAGDTMALCSAEGCTSCEYDGPFSYSCDEEASSPPCVNPGANEVILELPEGPVRLVVGVVVDGVEYTSEPFWAQFVPEPQQQETPPTAMDTVDPFSTEEGSAPTAMEAWPWYSTSEPGTGADTANTAQEAQGMAQGDTTKPGGFPWMYVIGGVIGILLLLSLLLISLWARSKKPDPCEKLAEEAGALGARVTCANPVPGSVPDPKQEQVARLKNAISDMEKLPQSTKRDQRIEDLRGELRRLEPDVPAAVGVNKESGADLHAADRSGATGVPYEITWEVETKERWQTIGSGEHLHLTPEQLESMVEDSATYGVVKVRASITYCPGTPHEMQFGSNTMQMVPTQP